MTELIKWFCENTDVAVHESVKVSKSAIDDPSSGYGLFVDMTNDNVRGETIELLRIPKMLTFDIHTVLALLSDEEQYSSKEEFQKTSQVVKNTIGSLIEFEGMEELLNESSILVCYFLLCTLIREKYELPPTIRYYLENILLTTKVDSAANYSSLLMKHYGQYLNSWFLEQMLSRLEGFFQKNAPHFELSASTLRQIYAAVTSRCLEIPQELDRESDDFTVNSTMIPLLDFCNHSNNPNAWFDVDRKTGDVLLLLDITKCKSNELQEVFISYTTFVELLSFFNTYGFVPSEQDFQFINVSIDREFLLGQPLDNQNLRVFYKWLHINPVIQLIKHKGLWYINDSNEEFAHILLAFLRCPDDLSKSCWRYDNRCYETLAHFHEKLDLRDSENRLEGLKFYKYQIRLQESQGNDYIQLPQLAWSMHYTNENQKFRRRVTKEQALDLAPLDDPRQFEIAIEQFKAFFTLYLNYREISLAISSAPSFNQLKKLEIDSLESVKSRMQQEQVVFWSDMDLDAPELPIPPLLSNFVTSTENEVFEDEGLPIDLLNSSSYDPNKSTDFYSEELEQFSRFL